MVGSLPDSLPSVSVVLDVSGSPVVGSVVVAVVLEVVGLVVVVGFVVEGFVVLGFVGSGSVVDVEGSSGTNTQIPDKHERSVSQPPPGVH
jgi:hypothetical protein